jgi:REP element-mobilizing transposase RayT
MSRRLRYFPPDSLVEVTTRTLQSRFLLQPTRPFARTVVGILARAQEKAPIRIHAVGGLSSHLHILATVDDAEQLGEFMEYANGNMAREALRLVEGRQRACVRRRGPAGALTRPRPPPQFGHFLRVGKIGGGFSAAVFPSLSLREQKTPLFPTRLPRRGDDAHSPEPLPAAADPAVRQDRRRPPGDRGGLLRLSLHGL